MAHKARDSFWTPNTLFLKRKWSVEKIKSNNHEDSAGYDPRKRNKRHTMAWGSAGNDIREKLLTDISARRIYQPNWKARQHSL